MYKLVTFDIYSASLDIYGSAIPKVQQILGLSREEAMEFFDTWRSTQWTYLLLKNSMKDGFQKYYDLTFSLLHYMERKNHITISNEKKKELMEIWTSFHAWPEAKQIIEELQNRGYLVAMLSNGDEEMLTPLMESTGIRFDYVFSGDMAGTYKPTFGIYQLPEVKLGIKKSEMLHVAGSMFDVMGAKAAGLNVAWSNRKHDVILDESYQPDYELEDLSELLQIL